MSFQVKKYYIPLAIEHLKVSLNSLLFEVLLCFDIFKSDDTREFMST